MKTKSGKKLSPPQLPKDREWFTVADLIATLPPESMNLPVLIAHPTTYHRLLRVSWHTEMSGNCIVLYSDSATQK